MLCGFCFCLLIEDLMPGKRVYMTASTAREHTNKLWEKEGKACEGTKKTPPHQKTFAKDENMAKTSFAFGCEKESFSK